MHSPVAIDDTPCLQESPTIMQPATVVLLLCALAALAGYFARDAVQARMSPTAGDDARLLRKAGRGT